MILGESLEIALLADAGLIGGRYSAIERCGLSQLKPHGEGVAISLKMWLFGREVSVQIKYDALGELIEKVGVGGNVQYVYDESRHIVSEYGNGGNLFEETIWMGDMPVAVIRAAAAWRFTTSTMTN